MSAQVPDGPAQVAGLREQGGTPGEGAEGRLPARGSPEFWEQVREGAAELPGRHWPRRQLQPWRLFPLLPQQPFPLSRAQYLPDFSQTRRREC